MARPPTVLRGRLTLELSRAEGVGLAELLDGIV